MDVGLAGDSISIQSVLEELRRRDRARQDQMSEFSGRMQALERLDAAIRLGGPAAEHLAALRAEVAIALSSDLAKLLAQAFMDGAGGSSAQGTDWRPAEVMARRYVEWRAEHDASSPPKTEMCDGLGCEQIVTDAMWRHLGKVHEALAPPAGQGAGSRPV